MTYQANLSDAKNGLDAQAVLTINLILAIAVGVYGIVATTAAWAQSPPASTAAKTNAAPGNVSAEAKALAVRLKDGRVGFIFSGDFFDAAPETN